VPAATTYYGCESGQHPLAAYGGAVPPLGPPCRGRGQGAVVTKAAAQPWPEDAFVQGHVGVDP
jgi:hypothetical protein